ncbi:MAG: hypothetical protein PHH09_03985 [Methanoregulaceae archaeon]|nr:hypothetical protein [Methanoregulaceae archaeon]
MNIEMFNLPGSYEKLNAVLNDPDIVIHSKHIIPAATETSCDRLYIFFESKAFTIANETAELERVKRLAKLVKDNPYYETLKNAKQREIYLLHEFRVCSKDAATIQELLKPEMAAVLGAE